MDADKIVPWLILAAVLGIELPSYLSGSSKDEAIATSRAASEWRQQNQARLERVEFLEMETTALRAQNTQLMLMLGYEQCE